jgi:hypothetical protein
MGRCGPTAWPPRSPDLNPLDFYLWGHLKTLVNAALVVDACQTIRNYPGIFERMRRSMMRRVDACIESHGGHFEHLFSSISQIKRFRTQALVCGIHAQKCPYLLVTPCICRIVG